MTRSGKLWIAALSCIAGTTFAATAHAQSVTMQTFISGMGGGQLSVFLPGGPMLTIPAGLTQGASSACYPTMPCTKLVTEGDLQAALKLESDKVDQAKKDLMKYLAAPADASNAGIRQEVDNLRSQIADLKREIQELRETPPTRSAGASSTRVRNQPKTRQQNPSAAH